MFTIAESNQLYLGDMIFYLISFLIMAALVWHFAWKPVTQMMQKRAEKIANDIDNAEHSRDEAAELAAKRQTELKGSRQEAAAIIDNAKKSGESQRVTIIETAQKDAQALKSRAAADAKQAQKDALESAKDDVANLSVTIAEKLIKKQLTAKDQQELIDSYIEGLGKHD